MKIIRGLLNVKEEHRGSVATIGNFDGVHLGHQKILSEVIARARELNTTSMLICFEPQPKEFFDVYNAPARLTRFREKVQLLRELGLDQVFCVKFDEKARNMTASEFVRILTDDLRLSALFVGDDFRFGQDRSGDYSQLQKAGVEHGFSVHNMYTIAVEDTRVSSTRIRESLAGGNFELAEKLLGRPYSITGKVIYGRQLGRTLGVPTANIQLHRYVAPISGVYACEMELPGSLAQGVANVGVRPTIDDKTPKPILEVYLFDFDGNLYGKTVRVVFRHKIREEKKFDGLDELKAAIAEDIREARNLFEAREP